MKWLKWRALIEIASETGGRYFRATTSKSELDQIEDEVSHMEKKQLETRLYQNLEDRFQVPLALAIFCLTATAWITGRRRPGGGLLARLYSRTRATRGDAPQ